MVCGIWVNHGMFRYGVLGLSTLTCFIGRFVGRNWGSNGLEVFVIMFRFGV